MRNRVAVLFVVVFLSVSMSAERRTSQAFNAELERQLAASHPGVLDTWKRANAARDADRYDEAIGLYADVYRRVPTFVHALRRQAGVELRAGRREAALTHARDAVKQERSADNLSLLADALVTTPNGQTAAADVQEAKELAREATAVDPENTYAHQTMAQVAVVAQDLDMLRLATVKLEALAPDDVGTSYFRAIVELASGNWDKAYAALDLARDRGLSQDAYDSLRNSIDTARPFYVRWWKPAAIAIVAWLGAFAALLGAGVILSRIALRASSDHAAGLSGKVRRLYAVVLGLSCAFYYASVPLVILIVVVFTGGIIYAAFALGHVPIKLVLIVGACGAITVWSMLKSLFMRRHDEEPGTRLEAAREPKLYATLQDVAARIGTHPVDNVYLTPSTDVAVMERGKGRKKERCLILGIAALDGLKLRPFKAILGHEYGHFTNRDTAGGAFSLMVRSSLLATAARLAEGGAATWYNPAWWFVNGFYRVFLRISEGASRLQEVLADRWAVAVYGAAAFEEGLRHVVERSMRFDAHVGVTLKEVVDGQVPLANLYTYVPASATEDVNEAVEEALQRKSSAYDSHPAPAERFALVHALPQPALVAEPDDDAPAWSLFVNAEALQHEMTAKVRENVRANYGVEIVAPEIVPAS